MPLQFKPLGVALLYFLVPVPLGYFLIRLGLELCSGFHLALYGVSLATGITGLTLLWVRYRGYAGLADLLPTSLPLAVFNINGAETWPAFAEAHATARTGVIRALAGDAAFLVCTWLLSALTFTSVPFIAALVLYYLIWNPVLTAGLVALRNRERHLHAEFLTHVNMQYPDLLPSCAEWLHETGSVTPGWFKYRLHFACTLGVALSAYLTFVPVSWLHT